VFSGNCHGHFKYGNLLRFWIIRFFSEEYFRINQLNKNKYYLTEFRVDYPTEFEQIIMHLSCPC